MAKAKPSLLGQLTLAVSSIAAIVFASTQVVKPVFVAQEPVVSRLVAATWRDTAAARAPWALADSGETALASAMATARFEADRALMWLAEADGQIVGGALGLRPNGGAITVRAIGVAPHVRLTFSHATGFECRRRLVGAAS